MSQPKNKKSDIQASESALEIARVRKVIGQLEGIERMLLCRRAPPQVIQQVKAASSALVALRYEILKRHFQDCLSEAASSGNYERLVDHISEALRTQGVK